MAMRIASGEFKGRALKSGAGPGLRPATAKVRQAVFSMLDARGIVWPGARVLDCFAGSGSLGFEALSRGAALAWFVENNRAAARIIQENGQALGLGPGRFRVVAKDVLAMLAAKPPEGLGGFELTCIDPPYGKNLLPPTLEAALAHGWIAEQGLVLAEIEAKLEQSAEIPGLETLVDRCYGQTRILLWKRNHDSPSTPAPSIP